MAAKKRRRFRGSPAQHEEVAVFNAKKLRQALHSGNVMASAGQCKVALHRLTQAAELHGAYHTEREWTQRGEKSAHSRALTQLEGKVRACFTGRR
jgi:hypothetical protein